VIAPTFPHVYRRWVEAFGIESDGPAAVGVKFVPRGDSPPPEAGLPDRAYTWCHSVKRASEGRATLVTRESVGCVMAGIALGLLDENEAEPLPGWRQYSQNMATSPAPRDYKEGWVLACAAAGREDFAMTGPGDSGRFRSVEAARRAFAEMPKIQPACMDGVVAFPPSEELAGLVPDVVVLALTPRETVRTIQGLTFTTGARFASSTLGVAGFCVDLVAYPYVTGRPNASFLCVGARVIARWEGRLNGLGLPWPVFLAAVEGMEASRTGYPYPRYPE
jgi:uncharacterized protein (DUF169 family)